MTILDEDELAIGVATLARRDDDLARIVERFGPPPLWARPPGFVTLLRIVLEQQVSLASAQAAFDRLNAAVTRLEPASFLALDDATLLRIGFSRQKARYVRLLARAIETGEIDLERLATFDDADASGELLALTGIGPWTASIYLLMALRRPDAWPATDMALTTAVADVRGLDLRPTAEQMVALAEPWRPWRAVAARILWHHYLSVRGR